MVYFVHGDDTISSHKEFNKLVAQFLRKEGGLSVFKIDEESFSEAFFSSLLKTESLFSNKILIVSKRLLEDFSSADYVLSNLEKLISSPNIFLFWEKKINNNSLKLIKKKVNNIQEFSLVKSDKKPFSKNKSIFRITDSFSLKQREKTWLLCQEELLGGMPVEDIFWKIIWQVKNLLTVKNGGGASLHPYVYQKTQKASSLFSEEELRQYSVELIDLYHKNRQSKKDIEIGLEKLILRL